MVSSHLNFSLVGLQINVSAIICCIQKRTKKTKYFSMLVEIVITNNTQILSVFMSTKLCTKSSKYSYPVDNISIRFIFLVNLHILYRMWYQILHYHELKIINVLNVITGRFQNIFFIITGVLFNLCSLVGFKIFISITYFLKICFLCSWMKDFWKKWCQNQILQGAWVLKIF